MVKILNLGCGNSSYGNERVDIVKTKTTTKVFDLEKGIPYNDKEFDVVYSSYFIEHIKNVGFILNEMYRVCKDDGEIIIITDNPQYLGLAFRLHGDYKGDNPKLDNHYSLLAPEHLRNHFNLLNINYHEFSFFFWENVKGKSKVFHNFIKLFLGERFTMPSYVYYTKKGGF